MKNYLNKPIPKNIFVDEISNHYTDLISKASTAPKDAWEHWEGNITIYTYLINPIL